MYKHVASISSSNNLITTVLVLLISFISFAQDSIKSTAQDNVEVIENFFSTPYSSTSRTVRIYLPPNYNESQKRYPVVYMLDGQNLFDTNTSYSGEWNVDETLNELSNINEIEAIVVGIDNHGAFRMQEYNIYPHDTFGQPHGEEFTKALVENLMPLINKKYRTLMGREYTAIKGSSMGGLMAYYIVMSYPEIFSKAGVFSPAFWVSEDLFKIHKENTYLKSTRIYMNVGSEEGGMLIGYNKMKSILYEELTQENFTEFIVTGESHGEDFWRKEFKKAFLWLFKS